MPPESDRGARCERHVGEVFRVRCSDCDEAASEAHRTTVAAEVRFARYEPGSDCPRHPGYPLAQGASLCDACAREGNELVLLDSDGIPSALLNVDVLTDLARHRAERIALEGPDAVPRLLDELRAQHGSDHLGYTNDIALTLSELATVVEAILYADERATELVGSVLGPLLGAPPPSKRDVLRAHLEGGLSV